LDLTENPSARLCRAKSNFEDIPNRSTPTITVPESKYLMFRSAFMSKFDTEINISRWHVPWCHHRAGED
jgi:hypothetical protein